MSYNLINTSQTTEEIHKIEYTGSVSELMPVVLKNLFFMIITLGIYRFWAKTNLRKYYWIKCPSSNDLRIHWPIS